ncbi:endonuclease/exonuclease/phosphatase family protein [Alloacidobacterium dinghuense]|uniref:Endonuclease/exonuclease/phosphatase family protein n=1 Tax=Alloacidobacterium dinghuense TaxID=2763107 RepID=A0A7G8BLM9_9BACT|nr:endonuclease/exonuclease/phosphatase family protein [Alloacidobacterium dinghuense]QNI33449.1 endonuclease/exonuclease/phosphatase family protein [Alloacidobacterium dinghuense]
MNTSSDKEIEAGSFAHARSFLLPPASIRMVDWNINKGLQLSGILDFLATVGADIILLQECDVNARRTHRLNIPREIAQKLKMNYIFGREFQELTQGSSSSPAYHGQATLSRWPLLNPRILRFKKQSGFWQPRWFLPDIELLQERTGGRMALVTEANIGGRIMVSYNLHLESRGDYGLRFSQLDECLKDTLQYQVESPIVLGGDLNMDVSRTSASSTLSQAQFRNAFSRQSKHTTPPHSFFDHGQTIDWVFTRGPMTTSRACVHSLVTASDHYPLSLQLAFV